ncbi:alpha-amylase family glycosyl hydrolase, partial [Salmonella enterica]|uniref:alpha-amylase family glycosyl hydrolase n=1 Tax=Salmonella enterica TaxID=28901 RepID=UPI0022B668A9
FFHTQRDLVQLSNINDGNPAVMDYFVGAYSQWIAQGADAFRIDTIRHMPQAFWHEFARRIRAEHPGFFMFGEAFDTTAANIAPFTWAE